jgi:hypothetical protein
LAKWHCFCDNIQITSRSILLIFQEWFHIGKDLLQHVLDLKVYKFPNSIIIRFFFFFFKMHAFNFRSIYCFV